MIKLQGYHLEISNGSPMLLTTSAQSEVECVTACENARRCGYVEFNISYGFCEIFEMKFTDASIGQIIRSVDPDYITYYKKQRIEYILIVIGQVLHFFFFLHSLMDIKA